MDGREGVGAVRLHRWALRLWLVRTRKVDLVVSQGVVVRTVAMGGGRESCVAFRSCRRCYTAQG